jgi:hypothetical protein
VIVIFVLLYGLVKNGHSKIVKLLLKDERVDPSDYNNSTIKMVI